MRIGYISNPDRLLHGVATGWHCSGRVWWGCGNVESGVAVNNITLKLQHVEEYLLACGWTRNAVGWVWPESIAEQASAYYGRGSFRLYDAIHIQVKFDVALANVVESQE